MAPIRRNKNRSHQNQQGLVVPDWRPELKLRDHPDPDHVLEDYSDVVNPETDVLAPEIYQDMERRLPPQLLQATRHEKLLFMRRIIRNHLPAPAKGIMVDIMWRQYIQNIHSHYQPLHPELYKMNPAAFFLPSFLRAIRGNTAESFMDIIHEVIAPSVYAFPMLRPVFCEMLMDEFFFLELVAGLWTHNILLLFHIVEMTVA
ncbi:2-oxoglutarate and iron-dependent oxygenase domain-containing protein CP2-like [Lolium perenne]|uniref:2-oxoglutarate and iron-dependent oxygenase domain-containing protein CP2-like n=1 Tax=Lolium perenne TaxID=4522 RepID=UPI003A99B187